MPSCSPAAVTISSAISSASWLNDASKVGNDPAQAINTSALNDILGVVETAYRDLAALRNRAGNPAVPIITHAYDFATPDGRGACTLGPWLLPSLQPRGWMRDPYNPADLPVGQGIVKQILLRFDLLMQMLEKDPYLNLIYVRTQGTSSPGPAQWDNELHPRPMGFSAIAEIHRGDQRPVSEPDHLARSR